MFVASITGVFLYCCPDEKSASCDEESTISNCVSSRSADDSGDSSHGTNGDYDDNRVDNPPLYYYPKPPEYSSKSPAIVSVSSGASFLSQRRQETSLTDPDRGSKPKTNDKFDESRPASDEDSCLFPSPIDPDSGSYPNPSDKFDSSVSADNRIVVRNLEDFNSCPQYPLWARYSPTSEHETERRGEKDPIFLLKKLDSSSGSQSGDVEGTLLFLKDHDAQLIYFLHFNLIP